MLDSKLLYTLATVIECKGFEKAASTLGVTQSAVSQRIKQLEDALGQTLLLRSQPLEVTPAGKRLHQYFCQLSLLETELMTHLQPAPAGQTQSRVRIAAEPDSLASWLLTALTPIMQDGPWQLSIDMLPEDENTLSMNSHLCGWISQDGSSKHGSQPMLLGTLAYSCVCSEVFFDRHLSGSSDQAWDELQAVVLSGRQDRHRHYLQQFANFNGSFRFFSMPCPTAMLDVIQSGLAYGLLPVEFIAQNQEYATLRTLPGTLEVPLYWHHWRIQPGIAKQLGSLLQQARQTTTSNTVQSLAQ